MNTRIALMAGLPGLLAHLALAQGDIRGSVTPDGLKLTAIIEGSRSSDPVVPGAPYCGDQVLEGTQVFEDGTRIAHPSRITRHCRDSAGRTRTEQPAMSFSPLIQDPTTTLIEISDPAAGYHFILDPVRHVASREALQPPHYIQSDRHDLALGQSIALGITVIGGITVEGRQSQITYRAGTMGNERPIVQTSETWYSPELKLMLLCKTIRSHSGEHVARWENLSRAEPNSALFEIPPDYELVDGPFRFSLH